MTTVCGAVIARDAAGILERCLSSMAWTDSLLVLIDDRTTDETAKVALRRGAKVETKRFVDFASQRNAALEMAGADWVLFVDADEVVTPELAAEVRRVIEEERPGLDGYWIPRKNILFGKWVRYAGWGPDHQLRLLRREAARYEEGRLVHELVRLKGEAGYLESSFVHYNYATLKEFMVRQRTYASMEAASMHQRGIRPRARNFVLQPWRQFWRRYVKWKGYKEGGLGILLSLLMAYYELLTYVDLRNTAPADTGGRGRETQPD